MPISKLGENAIGSAIGFGSGVLGSAINLGLQKNLMKSQFEYQKKAFEMQNARQDWLLQNSIAMQKQALRNAGYSTADPNGTGVNPAPVGSMDTPTQSSPSAEIGMAALQGAQVAANIKLANAQASKIQSETDYQKMYNELYAKYGEGTMKATLGNLEEDVKLKVATTLKTDQDRVNSIQTTKAAVDDIYNRLGIEWQKLEPTIKLMAAQAYEAEQSGKLKGVEVHRVWQDIKESNARIAKLMSDIQLNSAQIDVAYALVQNYSADTALKKASTGKVKAENAGQHIENAYNRLVYDVKNGLGVEWNQAQEVIKTFIPFAGSAAVLNK